MRLRACLGVISLGLGGCANIPAHLLLDVDGSVVEFKKKPPPAQAAENEVEPAPEAPADDEPAR